MEAILIQLSELNNSQPQFLVNFFFGLDHFHRTYHVDELKLVQFLFVISNIGTDRQVIT